MAVHQRPTISEDEHSENKRVLMRYRNAEVRAQAAKDAWRPTLTHDDASARGNSDSPQPLVYYSKSDYAPNIGNGVFASIDLYKGDVVTNYAGNVIESCSGLPRCI